MYFSQTPLQLDMVFWHILAKGNGKKHGSFRTDILLKVGWYDHLVYLLSSLTSVICHLTCSCDD